MTAFPDPRVVGPTQRAAARLLTTIDRDLGSAAPHLRRWLDRLLGIDGIVPAFLARRSHPLAHLPVWTADSVGIEIDEQLIEDLAYSSMSGYFFIRLIDDVMDADTAGGEARLLPGLALLHTEFAEVYRGLFDRVHPFWGLYRTEWMGTAEAAISDACADSIDERFFVEVTARKTRALMIPVGAVLHHHRQSGRIDAWGAALRPFCAWQQFHNDFFGWTKDADHGATTYLLSEASRQVTEDKNPSSWVWGNGVDFARLTLHRFEAETRDAIGDLGCAGFEEYVEWRFADADERLDELGEAIDTLIAIPSE